MTRVIKKRTNIFKTNKNVNKEIQFFVLMNTHTHMYEYNHVINLVQSTKQGNSIGITLHMSK